MLKTWASERDGDGPAGSSPHMTEATGPAEAVGPGGGAGNHSKHLANLLVRGEGWDRAPSGTCTSGLIVAPLRKPMVQTRNLGPS